MGELSNMTSVKLKLIPTDKEENLGLFKLDTNSCINHLYEHLHKKPLYTTCAPECKFYA